MKKSPRTFNWHFWVEEWKVQIIIPDTSYLRAVKKMKKISDVGCNYWHPNPRKYKFQFGERAI